MKITELVIFPEDSGLLPSRFSHIQHYYWDILVTLKSNCKLKILLLSCADVIMLDQLNIIYNFNSISALIDLRWNSSSFSYFIKLVWQLSSL